MFCSLMDVRGGCFRRRRGGVMALGYLGVVCVRGVLVGGDALASYHARNKADAKLASRGAACWKNACNEQGFDANKSDKRWRRDAYSGQ